MSCKFFLATLALTSFFLGASARAQVMNDPQAAAQQVATAQANLRQVQADLDRIEVDARKALADDPAYSAAQKELARATADRDAKRNAALAEVRASEGYRAQQKKIEEAEAVISAGNENRATARVVTEATSDAIDARLALSAMETRTLENSPAFQAAEAQYKSANAEVVRLWEEYKKNQLPQNRTWRAALEQRNEAELQLAQAQDQLRVIRQQAAAQRASAIQQQPRTRQPRQTRSSRSSGGSRRSRSMY